MFKRDESRIFAAIFDKRRQQSMLKDEPFFTRGWRGVRINCACDWQASQQVMGQSADEAEQAVRTKLRQQGMEIQLRNTLAILVVEINWWTVINPHCVF